MSKRCKSKTKRGQPCGAAAGPSGYCTFHDPALGRARAAGRKRGGQNRSTPHTGETAKMSTEVRTLDDVLKILDYALAESLPMENSVQRGRLLVAIAHAFIEAIKTGELENRLAQIEQALGLAQKGVTIVESQNAGGQSDGTSAGASEGGSTRSSL